MGKCHRNRNFSICLTSLDPDILECTFEALGLHGVNLRQTCKVLSQMRLSGGP